MSRTNWSRPRFQLAGKRAETIGGEAFGGTPTGPTRPRPDKRALNDESARLIAEFEARKAGEQGAPKARR